MKLKIILSLICFLFFSSCQSFKPHSGIVVLQSFHPDTISIRNIAVLPFRDGSLNPPENGTVICHLTGQTFKGGKVEPDSGRNVASLFYHVLLKIRFDKTQEALSENVLNIKNFLQGGGSWQTVEQLLSIGIEDALQSFHIR